MGPVRAHVPVEEHEGAKEPFNFCYGIDLHHTPFSRKYTTIMSKIWPCHVLFHPLFKTGQPNQSENITFNMLLPCLDCSISHQQPPNLEILQLQCLPLVCMEFLPLSSGGSKNSAVSPETVLPSCRLKQPVLEEEVGEIFWLFLLPPLICGGQN